MILPAESLHNIHWYCRVEARSYRLTLKPQEPIRFAEFERCCPEPDIFGS